MFSRALQMTAPPSLFVILPLFIWMQMTGLSTAEEFPAGVAE
jgi:hypothetical protein